jgi:hypothetical protein
MSKKLFLILLGYCFFFAIIYLFTTWYEGSWTLTKEEKLVDIVIFIFSAGWFVPLFIFEEYN